MGGFQYDFSVLEAARAFLKAAAHMQKGLIEL
jgi:hypothetical protein